MVRSTKITYQNTEPMRVNKFLAQQNICSRREAETLISKGVISIDGTQVIELGHKISDGQTLEVNNAGQKQLNNKKTYIMNKPEGYVSSQPEDGQTPAARLLVPSRRYYGDHRPPPNGTQYDMPSKGKLYAPLGRLDMDSRGLLILSEDGVLAKAIIGENSPLEKEYRVKFLGDITDEKLNLLREGMVLDDKPLRPAIVENPYRNMLAITLTEGRNRQIRRMCDMVELKVLDLVRIRVGPIRLRELPEGEWRPLTRRERDAVLAGENKMKSIPTKRGRPRYEVKSDTKYKPDFQSRPDFKSKSDSKSKPDFKSKPDSKYKSDDKKSNKPLKKGFDRREVKRRDG